MTNIVTKQNFFFGGWRLVKAVKLLLPVGIKRVLQRRVWLGWVSLASSSGENSSCSGKAEYLMWRRNHMVFVFLENILLPALTCLKSPVKAKFREEWEKVGNFISVLYGVQQKPDSVFAFLLGYQESRSWHSSAFTSKTWGEEQRPECGWLDPDSEWWNYSRGRQRKTRSATSGWLHYTSTHTPPWLLGDSFLQCLTEVTQF